MSQYNYKMVLYKSTSKVHRRNMNLVTVQSAIKSGKATVCSDNLSKYFKSTTIPSSVTKKIFELIERPDYQGGDPYLIESVAINQYRAKESEPKTNADPNVRLNDDGSVTKIYNKLVRDRMPLVIEQDGNIPFTRKLTHDEWIGELKRKLVEEAKEYAESGSIEELADLLEVMNKIAMEMHGGMQEVRASSERKFEQRGGFHSRIFLERVEFPPGSEVK